MDGHQLGSAFTFEDGFALACLAGAHIHKVLRESAQGDPAASLGFFQQLFDVATPPLAVRQPGQHRQIAGLFERVR